MSCVDTHCHLQMEAFDADRNDVLCRALDALDWIAVVGDDLDASQKACALISKRVFAVVGFHPYNASRYDAEAEAQIAALAELPGVIALGEMGLDYYNEFSPRPDQRRAFEQQLALAARLGKTAVIHSRAADEDTLVLLRQYAPQLAQCVMHCFGGDAQFARQCLDLGCYLSFAGNLTYPKATALREAVAIAPLDRLLVETDAPYLAPQCLRGKRCEPAFVLHTAAFLAQFLNQPEAPFLAQLVENAYAAFQLRQ